MPAPDATVAAEAPAASSPRRIVIVEDSRDSREMLRFLLEHAGHEVEQ